MGDGSQLDSNQENCTTISDEALKSVQKVIGKKVGHLTSGAGHRTQDAGRRSEMGQRTPTPICWREGGHFSGSMGRFAANLRVVSNLQ